MKKRLNQGRIKSAEAAEGEDAKPSGAANDEQAQGANAPGGVNNAAFAAALGANPFLAAGMSLASVRWNGSLLASGGESQSVSLCSSTRSRIWHANDESG